MNRSSRRRVIATIPAGVAVAGGCLSPMGSDDDPEPAVPEDPPETDLEDPSWDPPEDSPLEADVRASTVVSDLEVPWDLVVTDGLAYVTERDGGVLRFAVDDLASEDRLTAADADAVLAGDDLPGRAAPGEGGTLGIAVHPDYPDAPLVYVYYTADDGELHNRVVRYDVESDDLEAIVDDVPAAEIHNGGRIAFGPDDDLWVLTGDAAEPALAQDPSSLAGAVLRLTPDGGPAEGNPDFGDGSDPRTYSLGHRNPQGLAFTPDETPIVAEHGPVARDEISVLFPGGNYGWDLARGGPDDPEYDSYDAYEVFVPPIINTGRETTWGPSGIACYTSDAVPAWTNRLFVAGLAANALVTVTLTADGEPAADGDAERYDREWLDDNFTATVHRQYVEEFGRLRHVTQGPNGALYVLTSNRDGRASDDFPRDRDDRLVRLEPTD